MLYCIYYNDIYLMRQQIFFMNTDITLHLSNHNKLPEVFREEAHRTIREVSFPKPHIMDKNMDF